MNAIFVPLSDVGELHNREGGDLEVLFNVQDQPRTFFCDNIGLNGINLEKGRIDE